MATAAAAGASMGGARQPAVYHPSLRAKKRWFDRQVGLGAQVHRIALFLVAQCRRT